MSPTLEIVLWWVAFAGSHLLLSSLPVRSRLGAVMGERVVQGLYSLLVLGLFIPLLANGTATGVAFFGGSVIFALVGAKHQDARKIATNVPGYREFCAATPFLPFTGGETLRGLREAAPAAVIGVAATVVVRYFHAAWFGG